MVDLNEIKEAVEDWCEIREALEDVESASVIVLNAKALHRVFLKKPHSLLWESLKRNGLVPEDSVLNEDPGCILYTDRKTKCEKSPIGTCVEVGWHDECVYCKSPRYEYNYEGVEDEIHRRNKKIS
jgi:hypothetical protein